MCGATGPGGVLVIAPARNDAETGQLLGRISTGEVIANCAWATMALHSIWRPARSVPDQTMAKGIY